MKISQADLDKLDAIRHKLPDVWMVKRIKDSNNPAAWWVAANPRRGEGKIFAKDEWDKAMAYADEKANEVRL